jgi:outer membrane protein assembly factor BamB
MVVDPRLCVAIQSSIELIVAARADTINEKAQENMMKILAFFPCRTCGEASRAMLLLLFVVVVTTSGLRADDWPQFRGPNCSGISNSKKSLPVEFSAKTAQWSVDLGDGIGCPIVVAGRVFVSAMVDDKTIGLFAYDAIDGHPLWKRTWPTGDLAEVHATNSHCSTTPAADSQRVYFYFSTLGLRTVDAETGVDVWRYELPTPFFVFKWGPGMSPVLHEDKVIFCQDDDLHPAIYAFKKTTGKLLWKDERSAMAVNYSHPVVCQTERGAEIVVAGTRQLIGYDPDSGARLWYANTLLRNIKTTPVSLDGRIYISLQSSGIANQWLATADRSDTGNGDGKLSKEEMQAFVGKQKIPEAFFRKTFDRGDVNRDGFLEGEELDKAFLDPTNFGGARFDAEAPADEFIMAIRGGGRGDVTQSHTLWKHPTKHTDHIVSPLISQNRMLLITTGGIASMFETTGGTMIRSTTRIRNPGSYFASPIRGDGKIYVAGENGVVVVLQDSPSLEVLARNQMDDSIIATPAIAEGRLYIRTRSKLICVGH